MLLVAVICTASSYSHAKDVPLSKDVCLQRAHKLVERAGAANLVDLRIDPALGEREAFRIDRMRGKMTVTGSSGAGVLYGIHDYLKGLHSIGKVQSPDFPVRGAILLLMTEGRYTPQLTPKEIPWFYDRELLTRYLDYLETYRYNTLVLWSGHLFPSLVKLEKYPHATSLSDKQLAENNTQFRWLIGECARRNIDVLLHMYNIYIPRPLAKKWGISHKHKKPTPRLKQYTRDALEVFLKTHPSIGLFVCAGEVMEKKYDAEWLNEVVLEAARRSDTKAPILVRTWELNAEDYKNKVAGTHHPLYTVHKHNVEVLASPIAIDSHRFWMDVSGGKHVINLHEVSELKPFRWGSLPFIREMVRDWHSKRVAGAVVYGLTSWRWPNSLDKWEPGQTRFWPKGKIVTTFDRDPIWQGEIGRLLWDVNRDPQQEQSYWLVHFEKRFGSAEAAQVVLDWYRVTGSIMPGLQNTVGITNGNLGPTTLAREATLKALLAAQRDEQREPIKSNALGASPHDTYFVQRYKKRYNVDILANRLPMRLKTHAKKIAKGEQVHNRITPDRAVDLMIELADEGIALGEKLQRAATLNREDAARFASDAKAIKLTAQVYREKISAAIARVRFDIKKNPADAISTLNHLDRATKFALDLAQFTDDIYIAPTDLRTDEVFTWYQMARACQEHRGLEMMDLSRRLQPENILQCKGGKPASLKIVDQGAYEVWVHSRMSRKKKRGIRVSVNSVTLPATHKQYRTNAGAQRKDGWRLAGTVDLPKDKIIIEAPKGAKVVLCRILTCQERVTPLLPPDKR